MKLPKFINLVQHSKINLEQLIDDYKLLVKEYMNTNNISYDTAQQYTVKKLINKYNLKCFYKILQEENKLQGKCEYCLGIDNCKDYKK